MPTQPYARTQPEPATLAGIRRLLDLHAGNGEAERIRTLLNGARNGGLLSQEIAADALARLECLVPEREPVVEAAAEHLTRRFEVVPNGFGGTTTRVTRTVEPARTGKQAPAQTVSRAKRKNANAGLVKWVAGGYCDKPNDQTYEDGGCRRCARTGQFITGMHNGKPTGPGGICFRCGGKAMQTDCGPVKHREYAAEIEAGTRDTSACCDRIRNELYDVYGIRITW